MISCVTLWQVTSSFCALDFKIARRNQDSCTTCIQVHWTNYLINQPNKYLLSTYLAGCCIHRVVNQDRFGIYFPSPSSLVGCQPTKSKSPGQTQGDSTNRPYFPLLLTPEFTHLTLTWGGRRNVTPCGEVVERAGWKGPLMGAASTFSKQEQRLCHCGQEASNATRIIHDNYNQVRAEEKMMKMAMTWLRLLPPLHSH